MLSKAQQQRNNFATGALAEKAAFQFLQQKQYQVLERNLQINNCEVDIVAYDPQNDELVFIEVKARRSSNWGEPSIAVNWRKRRNMQQVAYAYQKLHGWQKPYRFDIITVVGSWQKARPTSAELKIKHYQNITW